MDSPDTQLAEELFSIANIITGFYVGQTLLFLNSLRTDNILRTTFFRKPEIARKYTWGFASMYLFVVVACAIGEILLRCSAFESRIVLYVAIGAGVSRLCIILALARVCQNILSKLSAPKDPSI